MSSVKVEYDKLVYDLSVLGMSFDRMRMLQTIQRWLRQHIGWFGEKITRVYGLDKYAQYELEQYPVEHSDLNAAEEVIQLGKCILPNQRTRSLCESAIFCGKGSR